MRMQVILPAHDAMIKDPLHGVADTTLELWRRQVHDLIAAGMDITITVEAV